MWRCGAYLLAATARAYVTILAIVVTRLLVSPIHQLADWVHHVALGELEDRKLPNRNDEIGDIFRNFERAVAYFQKMAAAISAAAEGNVNQVIC